MITAIDSNVLLDVLNGDQAFGPTSRQALRDASQAGAVVACEVVWAETTGWFDGARGRVAVEHLRIGFDPMQVEAAGIAGRAWRTYRADGGPRQRLLADFLIGAHAAAQADRLLTRDRGFYRRYFTELEIVDPVSAHG